MSAEAYKEFHRILAATHFKDVLLERAGCLGIENTLFRKELKAVRIKYLGPQIGVVARCIAVASEHMLEIGRTVTVSDFRWHTQLLGNLLFECVNIYGLTIGWLVCAPGKVQERGPGKLGSGEALIVGRCCL